MVTDGKQDNEIRYSRAACETSLYPYETELIKKEYSLFDFNNVKYLLSMFPYPSGKIHIGHIRNYTGTDFMVRAYKLLGYNVYTSMGYDAFGLPAENAARLHGISPEKWTISNIAAMNKTLKKFNFWGFDRIEQLITCDAKYYQHQQNFMKYLYEKGILYRKNSWVNWDPVEKTVLANEQVVNGRGWRSNAIVEQKQLTQWFIHMKPYASQLLNNLSTLNWPESIKNMQRHWIGESHGVIIEFEAENQKLEVFTTKPELIFGCTFIAISTHSSITSTYAIHPYTKRKLPILRADYVHENYATGVVMGVPSTSASDLSMVSKEEIIEVLENGQMINSSFLNGMSQEDARCEMYKKHRAVTHYSLHDWCISRQRAWGCIMPFIHCKSCGIVAAKEKVVMPPQEIDYTLPGNPLDHCLEWRNVKCHLCGGNAMRETDTMDTFVDSSWYFWRYPSQNSEEMCDERSWQCMPVDVYVGGAEHATMHLIYCRVYSYLICDYYNKHRIEPIKQLINQGMMKAFTYRGKNSGHYYHVSEISEGVCISAINKDFIGEEVIKGPCVKISKSYKNYDDLEELVEIYGTDVLRLFVLSDSPYEQEGIYDIRNIAGGVNLLNRIWSIVYSFVNGDFDKNKSRSTYTSWINGLRNNMYRCFTQNKFNNMVANFHKITHHITDGSKEQIQFGLIFTLQWLWCFCPAIATKCYHLMKGYTSHQHIFEERIDLEMIEEDIINYKVYIGNTCYLVAVLPHETSNIVEIAKQRLQNELSKVQWKNIIQNHPVRFIKFVLIAPTNNLF